MKDVHNNAVNVALGQMSYYRSIMRAEAGGVYPEKAKKFDSTLAAKVTADAQKNLTEIRRVLDCVDDEIDSIVRTPRWQKMTNDRNIS